MRKEFGNRLPNLPNKLSHIEWQIIINKSLYSVLDNCQLPSTNMNKPAENRSSRVFFYGTGFLEDADRFLNGIRFSVA